MLGTNLLSVGTESNTEADYGQTGLTGEQIFAGTETGMHETAELTDGFDRLIATADEISASVVLDKAGVESKSVTPEYVTAQMQNLESILALGINSEAPATVGTEAIHSDPLAALTVGIEAKEGIIKKIVRKAKDFIRLIISKIKEFTKKLTASAVMLVTNMKGLKDKADELEGGYKFDKKEDGKVHNQFRDALGFFVKEGAKPIEAVNKCITAIGSSYEEPSLEVVTTAYNDFKKNKVKAKKAMSSTAEQLLSSSKPYPTGPAGAGLRALDEDKGNVVALTAFSTPAGSRFVAFKLKTMGKTETATVFRVPLNVKVDSITLTGKISVIDIKDVAKKALEAFDDYTAKDVVTALYDGLTNLDKDISELSKTGKSKSVTRIMKLVSYVNAVSNTAIKAVISNQRAAYTAIKVLVDNAE